MPIENALSDLFTYQHNMAEQFCIASMLDNSDHVPFVKNILNADEFYADKHRIIVGVIYDLHSENIKPDLVAVTSALDAREQTRYLVKNLFEIYESQPAEQPRENVLFYASQVKQESQKRQLLLLIHQVYSDLKVEQDVADITHNLIEKIYQIQKTTELKTVNNELHRIMDILQDGGVIGIPTGFRDIDNKTCGYQNGELYVIGGRPRMGKTALALKLMANLCEAGHKVLFISLEMPMQQLLLRVLSIVSHIPYRCFREDYTIAESAWASIVVAASEINKWPMIINDNPGVTIGQIVSRIESEFYQNQIQVAFVDHMHLIPTTGQGTNNAESYSNISLALKNVARRLNIPIICLAQLNRGLEHRPDKRPTLSDLRESGGIEQNADNVWLLYNPTEYSDLDKRPSIQDIDLVIAKNKSLETGVVTLRFKGAYIEFEDKEVSNANSRW